MNNFEGSGRTYSNTSEEWTVKMSDAPEYGNSGDGGKRERAKVTPIQDLSPEERRDILRGKGGRLVAKPYSGDISKIGTSIQEAQAAASREPEPESEKTEYEMDEAQKAQVKVIVEQLLAVEKIVEEEKKTPEQKTPEQKKEEQKKKIGRAAWKVFEIIGGAVVGAGASAAIGFLANLI